MLGIVISGGIDSQHSLSSCNNIAATLRIVLKKCPQVIESIDGNSSAPL
jgi:hypothetical protein